MVKFSFSTFFTHTMFWAAMAVAAYNAWIDDYPCATFFLVLALFIEIVNLMEIAKRSMTERNYLIKALADMADKIEATDKQDAS